MTQALFSASGAGLILSLWVVLTGLVFIQRGSDLDLLAARGGRSLSVKPGSAWTPTTEHWDPAAPHSGVMQWFNTIQMHLDGLISASWVVSCSRLVLNCWGPSAASPNGIFGWIGWCLVRPLLGPCRQRSHDFWWTVYWSLMVKMFHWWRCFTDGEDVLWTSFGPIWFPPNEKSQIQRVITRMVLSTWMLAQSAVWVQAGWTLQILYKNNSSSLYQFLWNKKVLRINNKVYILY